VAGIDDLLEQIAPIQEAVRAMERHGGLVEGAQAAAVDGVDVGPPAPQPVQHPHQVILLGVWLAQHGVYGAERPAPPACFGIGRLGGRCRGYRAKPIAAVA
jgi:hypothetical protein